MKKKLIFIIPILTALLVFIGVYTYFNHKDAKTNLTVTDRNWISKHTSDKFDFEIINNFPIYSLDGAGVIMDFINDFEVDTNLEFNKIAYDKTATTKTNSLRIRVLENETALSENDLLITDDGYVLVSKDDKHFDSISDIKNTVIGIFTTDSSEVNYYLKNASDVNYKTYENIATMVEAFTAGDIKYMLIPEAMYLTEILTNDYHINYYFTEMSKKIVLTLTDDNQELNNIVKKYFQKWKEDSYVDSYNEQYLKYYIATKKINDKTKADMLSKTYVYGYTENLPYEKMIDGQVVGIASEYINRLQRLTDIDIEYKKYSDLKSLIAGITNGEVDFYFNYFGQVPANYKETTSPFMEKYVVLRNGKNTDNVTTFEELKGKTINMLDNDILYTYFNTNAKAKINAINNTNGLSKDNNLIVIDYERYNYYRNSKFGKYEPLYTGTITSDYTFGVLASDADIYNLFNYIMTTNSYYNYRQSGLKELNLSLVDRSSFQELYLIVLGIVLLPVLILTFLYLFLKNRKKKIVVKKEDRRKYTDILTSLKNRNYLNLNMKAWEESKVYPQTIVMIDLNNTKYVNDNYGHEAGDGLIIACASTLVNTQLENSEIIRTDGNEFLVYLVGYTEKQIETYCKKLKKEFKELPYGFGAALGYSMITDDIKTIDDAINEATLEMKTEKEELK